MPISLVMKVTVRSDAIGAYAEMTDEQRKRADAAANRYSSFEEKKRVIDMIADGLFSDP